MMTNWTRTVTLISLLALGMVVTACGETGMAPPTLESAPVSSPSPTPQPTSMVEPSGTASAAIGTPQMISSPPGLRVVYLREGNLWSWMETNGNVLLTDMGDMSTVRISEDGQRLAFLRGREVWTIRMDGTGLRLLATQEDEEGALWFSPDGSLLAISDADHVDVVDLGDETLTTVITYPAVPGGYDPQIVWSPDSSGFKTVTPFDSENGQMEFLYVFLDGTVARLGEFSMVSPAGPSPLISPDGGYVIYVSRTSEEQEVLQIMDSSGASKPYGEPAENILTYGWLPDSQQFVYIREETNRMFLGNVVGKPPVEMNLIDYEDMRWIDAERFLALQSKDLYLGDTNGGLIFIAEEVSDFDFAQ